MKLFTRPNALPALVIASGLVALIALLAMESAELLLPAREELSMLAPGGWLNVVTSPIDALWKAIAAHRLRTVGNEQDGFKEPLENVAKSLAKRCIVIPDARALDSLGLDTSRGGAGALYGIPGLSGSSKLRWLLALPLRDQAALKGTLFAALGKPVDVILYSPGLPAGGKIAIEAVKGGSNVRMCDENGTEVTPGKGYDASDGTLSLRLVSISGNVETVELFCKGVGIDGKKIACGCQESDSSLKSGMCKIATKKSGYSESQRRVGPVEFSSLKPESPQADEQLPIFVFHDRTVLIASDEDILAQALPDPTANRKAVERVFLSGSTEIQDANKSGWMAGDLQLPSPSQGRTTFAVTVSSAAVHFHAAMPVDSSQVALVQDLLAAAPKELPPLPAGSVAAAFSGPGIVSGWRFLTLWLPDEYNSLKSRLGYAGPILDSLVNRKIDAVQLAMLRADVPVPQLGMGLSMPLDKADALVGDLQRSMEENHDKKLLSETHSVSAEHHPGHAIDQNNYRFLIGSKMAWYITPPVTEGDFRLGAYKETDGTVHLDKAGLLEGRYRVAGVYQNGALWLGGDRDTLGAIVSGLNRKNGVSVCENDSRNARGVSLCLSPNLVSLDQVQPNGPPTVTSQIQGLLAGQRWIAAGYQHFRTHLWSTQSNSVVTLEMDLE
jgi:hypothetical protein